MNTDTRTNVHWSGFGTYRKCGIHVQSLMRPCMHVHKLQDVYGTHVLNIYIRPYQFDVLFLEQTVAGNRPGWSA